MVHTWPCAQGGTNWNKPVNPVMTAGLSCKLYCFPCNWEILQQTAQWDVNVSIGAKDWWHPTTRHNSDFSSLHVVNTQNSFVYHMEGVTSIIFRNFLSEPLQNFTPYYLCKFILQCQCLHTRYFSSLVQFLEFNSHIIF